MKTRHRPVAAKVSRQLASAGHIRHHMEEASPGSKVMVGVPGFRVRQHDGETVRVQHLERHLPSPNTGHAVALEAYMRTLEDLGYQVMRVDGRTLHVSVPGTLAGDEGNV